MMLILLTNVFRNSLFEQVLRAYPISSKRAGYVIENWLKMLMYYLYTPFFRLFSPRLPPFMKDIRLTL